MVDAGGGTIDAVTYKCAHDEPLRLSEEVVAPDSKHNARKNSLQFKGAYWLR